MQTPFKKYAFALSLLMGVGVAHANSVTYGSNSPIIEGSGNVVSVVGNGNTVITVNGKTVTNGGTHAIAEGEQRTESREIATFNSLSISSPAEVTFTKSDVTSLEVTAGDRVLKQLSTTVSEGNLEISLDGAYNLKKPITIKVSGPNLNAVDLVGSGSFTAMNLNEKKFEVKITGSGNVFLKGAAEQANIKLTGSGNIQAKDLIAQDLWIDLSGSGNIQAYTAFALDADLSGSGNITVHGTPLSRKTSKTGSGKIDLQIN
jgi:hypothetical protein